MYADTVVTRGDVYDRGSEAAVERMVGFCSQRQEWKTCDGNVLAGCLKIYPTLVACSRIAVSIWVVRSGEKESTMLQKFRSEARNSISWRNRSRLRFFDLGMFEDVITTQGVNKHLSQHTSTRRSPKSEKFLATVSRWQGQICED